VTVTGGHTYVLEYDVGRALTAPRRKNLLVAGGVTLATSAIVFVVSLIVTVVSGLDGLGYVPVCQALTGVALLVMAAWAYGRLGGTPRVLVASRLR